MAAKSQPAPQTIVQLSRRFIVITTLVACFFLLLFNTAVWLNRYVMSTDKFSETALPALLNQSSTQAIASEVTDKLLEDRPVLKSTLNDRVVSLVAALLQTDLSERLVERSVRTLQISLTTANPKVVAIDLSGIKNVVAQILSLGRELTDRPVEEQRIDVDDVPDQIVIFDPSTLPSMYAVGLTALWLTPLALLTVLGCLLYPLYRAYRIGVAELKRLLTIQGGAVVITGLLALSLGPLVRPTVLAQVSSENLRVVTENLLTAFLATFNEQTIWFILVPGFVMLLVALVLQIWPWAMRTYRNRSSNTLKL